MRSWRSPIWRWLPELLVVAAVVVAYVLLIGEDLPPWAAVCVVVAPVTVLLVIPPTGRMLSAWFWVDVTRHRLRTFMSENGLRNKSGRLPWLLAIYPTAVGERAWMVLVGGICVNDVEERLRSLGSTCYAREGRVTAHRRWTHLIRIDITRRDPLDSPTPVGSKLLGKKTEPQLVPAVVGSSTPKASQWAVGIGLPLNNNTTDDGAANSYGGVNGQAKTNGQVHGRTAESGGSKSSPRKSTTTQGGECR